jgi:hypothetical protein
MLSMIGSGNMVYSILCYCFLATGEDTSRNYDSDQLIQASGLIEKEMIALGDESLRDKYKI